jgi:hypothetical protein
VRALCWRGAEGRGPEALGGRVIAAAEKSKGAVLGGRLLGAVRTSKAAVQHMCDHHALTASHAGLARGSAAAAAAAAAAAC